METARGNKAGPIVLTVLVTLLVTGLVLALAAALAIRSFDPFGSETIDRSGPTMLERIRTLEEFTAAEGNFTQDVDIQRDADWLPDFIAGERVVAIVTGSVRATVDFGEVDEDAIEVDEETSTIRISLPPPVLSDADIDEQSVRIISRERGLVDRVDDFFSGNPIDDRPVFQAAEARMVQAANESDLLARASANTEQWLRTFLGAAGFETVYITWDLRPA